MAKGGHIADNVQAKAIKRRGLAFMLVFVMLCSLVPSVAFAEVDAPSAYPCGHTCDDSGACGYIPADAGVPCDHIHDVTVCGCIEGSPLR